MENATPSPTLLIRPATPADVPSIHLMVQELAIFENLEKEFEATEAGLHKCLFGSRPYAEAVIGEFEGRPIAFALYFFSVSTFLGKPGIYLEDLYVKPAFRHRGFGTQILRHVAKHAVKNGFGRFEWAVLSWNQNAIDAYDKTGAVPLDEWKTYRLAGSALQAFASK